MLIDWYTVIAQVLNFLLLVWLLKRFLYQPVLKAISQRDKLVAGMAAEAEKSQQEARKTRDHYQELEQSLTARKGELLQAVRREADREKEALLGAARQEYQTLKARLKASLVSEQQALEETIFHRTEEAVFSLLRKLLEDLADTRLDEGINRVLLNRLTHLDPGDRETILRTLDTEGSFLLLRSARDLESSDRNLWGQGLKSVLGREVLLHFETDPSLIGGMELRAGGYKLNWSMSQALEQLKQIMNRIWEESIQSDNRNNPTSDDKAAC